MATERPETCASKSTESGNLGVIAVNSKSQMEWELSSFQVKQVLCFSCNNVFSMIAPGHVASP